MQLGLARVRGQGAGEDGQCFATSAGSDRERRCEPHDIVAGGENQQAAVSTRLDDLRCASRDDRSQKKSPPSHRLNTREQSKPFRELRAALSHTGEQLVVDRVD